MSCLYLRLCATSEVHSRCDLLLCDAQRATLSPAMLLAQEELHMESVQREELELYHGR